MKRHIFLAAAVFLAGAAWAGEGKLPAALVGGSGADKLFESEVLKPNGITAVKHPEWLKPDDYGKYSVVFIGPAFPKGAGWTDEASVKAAVRYVEGGGVIVVNGLLVNATGKSRDLTPAGELLGFSFAGQLGAPNQGVFKFVDKDVPAGAGLAGDTFEWFVPANPQTVDKITTAKVLAVFNGEKPMPALTVNRIGKGAVYWLGPVLYQVNQKSAAAGIPDENGVFTPGSGQKSVAALSRLYAWLFGQSGSLATVDAGKESGWGDKPLGAPGSLTYTGAFANQPVFKKPQPLVPGMPLAENGQAVAEIVVPANATREQNALAAELKYHLDAITGGDFPIVKTRTDGKNAVVLADAPAAKAAGFDYDGLALDTALAVTEGNTVLLGGPGAGTSLATYYFLEKLGCRYLWPGKLGKVVPKDPSLKAPKLRLAEAPEMSVRFIRGGGGGLGDRDKTGFKNLGLETAMEGYVERYQKLYFDKPGNADFYRWHGQRGVRPEIRWGHSFGDYYQRFGKTHPEFFALQPDGTRDQSASVNRPRLCKANAELAATAAEDVLNWFKKNPNAIAGTIGLPDGGYTGFCLCEDCRKLDPVNATPTVLRYPKSATRPAVDYVSLTDRVLFFSNRIAAAVTAALPGKKLTMYAYSIYGVPPVKVAPHPALIICAVPMSYTRDTLRQDAMRTLAAWSTFGNDLFWRPNALWWFYRTFAPQNYARKIFQDTELLKANNLKGTDFDCNEQHWSSKGLIYYALSKALWNPDRLDYDDIVADYCRAGFGDAAPEMVKYFGLLEKASDAVAADKDPKPTYLDFFTEKVVAELRACLDEAKRKTAGDETIAERLRFLELGLRAGEMNRKLHVAKAADDQPALKKTLEEYLAFLAEVAGSQPLAINVGHIGYYSGYRKQ